MDVPFGTSIIPGTKFPFVQPVSGNEFSGENDARIDQTAEYEVTVSHHTTDRGKEGCKPVNRKHPYRCDAGKTKIPFAECMESGKTDFQKPA